MRDQVLPSWATRILSTRDLSGTSEVVRNYETELTKRFRRRHAIATSSGTAALHASYVALNISSKSHVVVSPLAAVMTAAPLLMLGAKPLFIDTERGGFNLDPCALRKILRTTDIAAIVTCGMWGTVGLSDEVKALADEFGVPVIEDAAQSLGAGTRTGLEGCKGLLGCFSTHANKLLSTGEGGFVLTDDDALAAQIRSFIRIGHMPEAGYGLRPGLNYKLSALQCSYGLDQLAGLDNAIEAREEVAQQWLETIAACCWMSPIQQADGAKFAPYAQLALLNEDIRFKAPAVAKALQYCRIPNDYSRYNYKLLQEFELFKPYAVPKHHLFNATELLSRLVVLPTRDVPVPSTFDLVEENLRSTLAE
jgi:perosamine synthetase